MARWLVTGGLGFIGYHVSRALLARGDHVTIADDMSEAPYPVRYKERNLKDLRAEHGARLRFDRGDVSDRAFVAALYQGGAVDPADDAGGVLHLAGIAGVRPSFRDPARYTRVNVEGTAVMMEQARALGVRRFLFASSSSVYGNATPLPAREESPAIVPESPYAATKRAAELVASAICLGAPTLSCTALRFFTVYGPRQRPEMAITLFTRAILEGRPITVFGDGGMRRDFTHIDDIVRGILASAARPIAQAAGFRAYNLGSGAPIDLASLVRMLGEVAGRPVNVTHAPVPTGDVEATFADLTRARAELGWEPRVPLLDGLRSVLEWATSHD
jgi:UDP-glucuronate 4-epimerase